MIHFLELCLKRTFINLVKLYQRFISPYLPPSCIYIPTCSNYAIAALQKHGLLKGGIMALMRVFRCTPFHRGGFDPVK